MRRIPLFVALIPLVACASGNGSSSSTQSVSTVGRVDTPSGAIDLVVRNLPNVVATRIDAPPDKVWGELPTVFEEIGIPIGTVDAGEQLMGNRGVHVQHRIKAGRLSQLLTCGDGPTGPTADSYDVNISVLTRLEADGKATLVRTAVEGRASNGMNGGSAVHCGSTGALEQKIANALALRTAGH